MAVELPIFDVGILNANMDLSGSQFRFVKLVANAAGIAELTICTAAGEKCVGVLQDKPTLGKVGTVRNVGLSKVIAGAAITAGAAIMTDATGAAITAATTGSTEQGFALEAATAAGQIITALLNVGSGVV